MFTHLSLLCVLRYCGLPICRYCVCLDIVVYPSVAIVCAQILWSTHLSLLCLLRYCGLPICRYCVSSDTVVHRVKGKILILHTDTRMTKTANMGRVAERSAISSQRSSVIDQSSEISISDQRSAVSDQQSAISSPRSAGVSGWRLTFEWRSLLGCDGGQLDFSFIKRSFMEQVIQYGVLILLTTCGGGGEDICTG